MQQTFFTVFSRVSRPRNCCVRRLHANSNSHQKMVLSREIGAKVLFFIVLRCACTVVASREKNIQERVQISFLSGLVGDALALGGHYEYDAVKIKQHVGSYRDFKAAGEGMGGETHGVGKVARLLPLKCAYYIYLSECQTGWGSANYHPGKKAGDLTDSGEVAIMLLEYLVEDQKYDFDGYARYWKQQIDEGYGSCNFQSVGRNSKQCPPGTKPGYLNGATRRTLQALQQQPNARGQARKNLAADVNCLVAATHFLPLFFMAGSLTPSQLVEHSVSTVYLSHKHHDSVVAAEFLSRTLYLIIFEDKDLEIAMDSAAAATHDSFISQRLADAKAKVKEALNPASDLSKQEFVDDIAITSMARLWDVGKSEPIKVGKASPTEGALPAAIYFALKYKHSLEEALISNANVGGDSAVRGMVIGMLLGAVHGGSETGRAAIPDRWLRGLNSLPHVESLFRSIQSQQQGQGQLGGTSISSTEL